MSRSASASKAWAALERGLLLFLLWIVLMPSAKPADLVVGLFAAALGAWTSLHLLPPESGHLRLLALIGFVPHFLWQSVLAGVDVARRALSPRMPLAPGLVDVPVGFPPGLARNEFVSIVSLMPGSLPVGEAEASVVFHSLDTAVPLAPQIAEEEKRLRGALVVGERHV